MKKITIYALLCAMLLSGCGVFGVTNTVKPEASKPQAEDSSAVAPAPEPEPEVEPEEPEPEPEAKPEMDDPRKYREFTEEVTLYIPDENVEHITPIESVIWNNRPQALVDALVGIGALPEGSAVLSWDEGTGALDMNEAYGTAVSSTGTTGELMWIGTLINTFFGNYDDVDTITLRVEGEILETGHAIYDESFTEMLALTPEG